MRMLREAQRHNDAPGECRGRRVSPAPLEEASYIQLVGLAQAPTRHEVDDRQQDDRADE